jgi:plasmid maintenance system antidote protein VapI
MRIGRRTADDLARAFDIDPEFFINLEVIWLNAQGVRV